MNDKVRLVGKCRFYDRNASLRFASNPAKHFSQGLKTRCRGRDYGALFSKRS